MDPHLRDILGCQCHQTSETTEIAVGALEGGRFRLLMCLNECLADGVSAAARSVRLNRPELL